MLQSKVSLTFAESIKDAENLLAHFNKLNTLPPPPETAPNKKERALPKNGGGS